MFFDVEKNAYKSGNEEDEENGERENRPGFLAFLSSGPQLDSARGKRVEINSDQKIVIGYAVAKTDAPMT